MITKIISAKLKQDMTALLDSICAGIEQIESIVFGSRKIIRKGSIIWLTL